MKSSADLRTTFDQDAERYNTYRPGYPHELFSKLVRLTHITKESRLLEIGPGTGQATKPLAALGCSITGIELGESLAVKARTELAQYPRVNIITGAYEGIDLPTSAYNLIFSATAFHWIKAEHKFAKTAALLKPHGYLAIIHTEHVSDEHGDAFTVQSQPIYDKYFLTDTSTRPDAKQAPLRLPTVAELTAPSFDSRLFELISFDTFPVTLTYTAEQYAGLLSTYSPIIALPASKRTEFLAEVARLIRTQFGGTLEKQFAFTLTILQKK